MKKKSKPRASLGVTESNVPGVLARAGLMETAILLAAAMFQNLPIAMSAFLLLIQAAATAQSNAASRTMGLASIRDTKVAALWTAMQSLKTYVQGLANGVDATSAIALIEQAGLLVASTSTRVKLLFSATFVPATGVVHLSVNATLLLGKRPTKKTDFTYSWSTDGGKTWPGTVTTSYTSVDVPNLPPGSYLFRVVATVARVPGPSATAEPLTIH
jgi:hypothetical protein